MKLFGAWDVWIGIIFGSLGILLWVFMSQKYKLRDALILLAFDIFVGLFFFSLLWSILGLTYVTRFFRNLSVIGFLLLLSGSQAFIFLRKRDLYAKYMASNKEETDNI